MRAFHLIAILCMIYVCGMQLLLGTRLGSANQPSRIDARLLSIDEIDQENDYSNVLPEDYVGPESCAECHQQQYSHWQDHPHSCMNQLPDSHTVKADFADAEMTLPAGRVEFTTDDDQFWMTVFRADDASGNSGKAIPSKTLRYKKYVVTRTVGSRYMQYFIGRQTAGPEPFGADVYKEHMLPFAFGFRTNRWYPRQYFDTDGDEKLHHGVPQVEAMNGEASVRLYTEHCMNCHNTMPYTYRIFRPKLVGYRQGVISAAVGPLSEALAKSGVQVEPNVEDFEALNGRLNPEKDLITMGISCESCHLGGREHAERERDIKFLPTSKLVKITTRPASPKLTEDRSNASTIVGICTQCHSGGSKSYPNGSAKSNSREALDMEKGFCSSQLQCVDCHEPHTAGPISGGVDQPSHIQSCLDCHEKYADPQFAAAHTGHPAAANLNCLDCHMPKITQGLQNIIRTHQIQHPAETVMLRAGSANACNTCHLDKSTSWTVEQLNRKWELDVRIDRNWPIYEQRNEPMGDIWINGNDTHLRLLATQSYARSPLGKNALAGVIRSLNDPEPLNRLFGSYAVREILGWERDAELPVDITQTPKIRDEQIKQMIVDVLGQTAVE